MKNQLYICLLSVVILGLITSCESLSKRIPADNPNDNWTTSLPLQNNSVEYVKTLLA